VISNVADVIDVVFLLC